jgi:hypothetical protein
MSTSVELRASWSPLPPAGTRAAVGPQATVGAPRHSAYAGGAEDDLDAGALWTPAAAWSGLAAHVEAWSRCLAAAVGLPPELAGVARLPRVGG